MKILKYEKTSIILVVIGILLIFFAAVSFLWLDIDINTQSKINSEKFGQFGDFIGGIVGSLWALAGVLLFYIALTEQRNDFKTNQKALELQIKALNQQVNEFELQRKELESSRKVYEQQSKTLKIQQFESNFYSLLNVYLSIKERLNNLDENKDFFRGLFNKLTIEYSTEIDLVAHHEKMVASYTQIFLEHRGHLSHYFKTFYRIIKIIDTNLSFTDQEKSFYSKIIRSQLTDYEQLVLFYNSHSIYGIKARPLFLKYNLLKHNPIFNKPEFSYFLSIHKNNDLLFFTESFNQFITKHINDSFDIAFDKESIVEKFEPYECLIGIYFSDILKLEVTCFKNINENKINLNDEQFANFLLALTIDRIVLNTYTNPNNVLLKKYTTDTDESKIFGITIKIEAETSLKLTFDKF